MTVDFQKLKLGDVLIPKRAKVPRKVIKVFYYRTRDGEPTQKIDYVHLEPMDYWKGVTYNAKSSYSSSLYIGDAYLWKLDGNVNEDQQGENKMAKLFKVIGEEVYGIHIGTNTAGEFVLEIRGDANNAIKAFKKDLLEEVKPYTVKLVAIAGTNNPRHATIEKGKVNKNDVIVWSGAIWTVVELDTKQDNCPEITEKNCKRLVVGEL